MLVIVVHTNLTSLSRGLRRFITYQKNGLVNVDLKCSQPFFLSILLCANFYSDNPLHQLNLTAIEQYSPKELRSTKQLQNGIKERIANTITLCNSKSAAENDIKRYIEEVQNGTFYEYFQGLIELETGKMYTRKEVKALTYRVLFTHNYIKTRDSKEKCAIFKKCFPTVYSVIELLKTNRYETLAILLQSIESYIFIDRIAKRITADFPDLPFYTIHDSILTLADYKNEVAEIIRSEIFIATGLNPKLDFD